MAKKEANKKEKANSKEKVNSKENNKNKKSFFKGFKAELKKVIWPTPKQLVNNTVAVIVIVLVTAAIVFVLDLAFEAMNKQGIDKIKSVIGTENTTTNNATDENTVSGETTENSNTAVTEEAQTTENSETTTETNQPAE